VDTIHGCEGADLLSGFYICQSREKRASPTATGDRIVIGVARFGMAEFFWEPDPLRDLGGAENVPTWWKLLRRRWHSLHGSPSTPLRVRDFFELAKSRC
jgi:hypothetical protein